MAAAAGAFAARRAGVQAPAARHADRARTGAAGDRRRVRGRSRLRRLPQLDSSRRCISRQSLVGRQRARRPRCRCCRPGAATVRRRCRSCSGTGRSRGSFSSPERCRSTASDRSRACRRRRDTCSTAGGPIRGPLVVDEYGSTVRLRGAASIETGPTATLWVPAGRPRLSLYATGRYYDGWLASAGAVSLWPEAPGQPVSGWLSMRLTAPPNGHALTLTFRLPGGERMSLRLRPGASRRLRIAACSDRDWHAAFRSSSFQLIGLRAVSVRASEPVFTPSSSACPVRENPVA